MEPEEKPDDKPPVETPPVEKPADPTVTISQADLTNLWTQLNQARSRIEEIETKSKKEAEDVKAKALQELAAKDGAAAALQRQKEELEAEGRTVKGELAEVVDGLKAASKRSVVDGALVALADRLVDPNAADYIRSQLEGRYTVEAVEGQKHQFRVRDSKTGQIVSAEAAKAQVLADPKLAWALKAEAAPGATKGNPGGRPEATPEDEPKDAGSRALKKAAARKQVAGRLGLTPPSAN
jgi:hypothetical protein